MERNRGVGRDAYSALKSGRIGPTGWRTFHCKLRALKGSGRGRIAYIHGLDQEREDIVLTDERTPEDLDRTMVMADIEAIQIGRHKGAEMPKAAAFTNVVELPYEAAELTKEKLAEMCNGIAGELRQAATMNIGRTTWAVHRAGKAENLHLHIVALAYADRPDNHIIPGSDAMKAWRRGVAAQINQVCGTTWHGGTLADTGIDRPAKKRLPHALYRAREDVAAMGAETLREPPAVKKRRKLAAAADRVQAHLDDLALKEWQERKKREAEQEAAAKAAALRDPGTGAVPPETHRELEARGLTTLRRAAAKEKKAKDEGWQEGYSEAQKALQRPSKGPPGVER